MSKFADNFKKKTLPVKIADIAVILLGLAVIVMSLLSLSGVVYISQSIIQILSILIMICLAVGNWITAKIVSIVCIAASVFVLVCTLIVLLKL